MPVMKPPFGTRLIRGHPLAGGLVGCWVFNEGMGGTVYDSSGFENHGVASSAVTWSGSSEGIGATPGSGGFPASASTDLKPDSVTQVTGVVPNLSSTAWRIVAGTYDDANSLGYGMTVEDYTWSWYIGGGGGHSRITTGAVTNGVACIVAGTYSVGSPGVSASYLNGSLLGSSTWTITPGTRTYTIGAYYDGSRVWPGQLLFNYLYNRVLTRDEIAQITSDPYQIFEKPGESLHRYWYLPIGTQHFLTAEPTSLDVYAAGVRVQSFEDVSAIPGATHYLPITANRSSVAANMPDATSTFAADLVIDEAQGINFEGSARMFIDGLRADHYDLRVFADDGVTEIPFGVKQFSQTIGARKLVLGLGIPSSYPLSATADTTYRLYRGCSGGSWENKAGVVPTADGYVGVWTAEDTSGSLVDWTTNIKSVPTYGTVTYSSAGKVGDSVLLDGSTGYFRESADDSSFDFAGDFSVMGWSKCIQSDSGVLMQKGCYGGTWSGWILNINANGTATFGVNSTNVTGGSSLDDGSWRHLAGVRSGSTGTLYADGASVNSGAVGSASTDSDKLFSVGVRYNTVVLPGLAWYLNGNLDELYIANVARSANWITTYYSMTSNNSTFWAIGEEVRV